MEEEGGGAALGGDVGRAAQVAAYPWAGGRRPLHHWERVGDPPPPAVGASHQGCQALHLGLARRAPRLLPPWLSWPQLAASQIASTRPHAHAATPPVRTPTHAPPPRVQAKHPHARTHASSRVQATRTRTRLIRGDGQRGSSRGGGWE
jgi:hypothetical protein